jgi:hypothetical protein
MNRALPALLHREGLEPESWLEPVDEKDGWATAWPTSEVRRAMMNGDASLSADASHDTPSWNRSSSQGSPRSW